VGVVWHNFSHKLLILLDCGSPAGVAINFLNI
jgi:hypothetical protein